MKYDDVNGNVKCIGRFSVTVNGDGIKDLDILYMIRVSAVLAKIITYVLSSKVNQFSKMSIITLFFY